MAAQAPVPTATVPPPPTVAPPPLPPPSATPPPPPPPPAETRGHTAWPWVATGVGAGAVIAGGILFLVGNGKVSTAESKCTPSCVQSVADSGTSGANLRTDGAVVFWAGLGVAGAGILWHFLEPTGPASDTPKTSFAPVVGPGYTGGSLVGSF